MIELVKAEDGHRTSHIACYWDDFKTELILSISPLITSVTHPIPT
jgi:hypothetical protein